LSRGQLKQRAARASSKMRRDGLDPSEITKPLASGHRHACERDAGQRANAGVPEGAGMLAPGMIRTSRSRRPRTSATPTPARPWWSWPGVRRTPRTVWPVRSPSACPPRTGAPR